MTTKNAKASLVAFSSQPLLTEAKEKAVQMKLDQELIEVEPGIVLVRRNSQAYRDMLKNVTGLPVGKFDRDGQEFVIVITG